jgi:replicative DNA helicase
MTRDNSKKKAIRKRMSETGESYSVAARRLGTVGLKSWSQLDALIGGFECGKLYIIASENGGGRTSFAINLLDKFAQVREGHVLYLNLEMDNDSFMRRVNRASDGVTVTNSHLSSNDSKYARTTEGIRKLAEEMNEAGNFTAMFLDYIQLLDKDSDKSLSEQLEESIAELRLQLSLDCAVPS